MRLVEIVQEEPHIAAHRSGNMMWIDNMEVPPNQRRRGIGRAYYEEWEKNLPKDIEKVVIFAADTGDGNSDRFWQSLGFDYRYDGENLDYESQHMMWKGVNGHPTPPPVNVDDD